MTEVSFLGELTLYRSPFISVLFFNCMEISGYRQRFAYQHSSKYLLLCSTEDLKVSK